MDRITFLDQRRLRLAGGGRPDYDVLVYSVLTDYTQGLYRHRDLGLIVPWHQFNLDATDPVNWPWLERRFAREGMDRSFFQWFADEFECLGGISVDRFQENIRWLAGSLPEGARMILLNGAEVPDGQPERAGPPPPPPEDERGPRRGGRRPPQRLGLRHADVGPQPGRPDVGHPSLPAPRLPPDGRGDPVHRRFGSHRAAADTRGSGRLEWAWRFAGRRKVQVRRTWRRLNGRPVGRA